MYPNFSVDLSESNNGNLNNLLGQTINNTIILKDQTKYNIQNPPNLIEYTKTEENKQIPNRNAYYYHISPQKRNYGYNNLHMNYVHPFDNKKPQNKVENNGLLDNLRKLNSIKKNGKLIYNIDVNTDSQGLIQKRLDNYPNNINNKQNYYNKPNYNNYNHHYNNYNNNYNKYNNNYNNYNNNFNNVPLYNNNNFYNNQILNAKTTKNNKMNQNNNQIKENKEIKYNQNHSKHPHHLPKQLSQHQPNKKNQSNNETLIKKEKEKEKVNNSIKPGIIEGKLTETIYQIQDNNINNINNIKDSEKKNKYSVIPKETVKSTYQMKESKTKFKNSYTDIIPQETIKSTYQNKDSKTKSKNPYPDIIPQETIRSFYQNTHSNNKVKKSQNSPNESIYYNQKEKIELNKENRQKLFSEAMPNETIVSVYQDQNKQLENDNTLLRFLPNETIKSIYQKQE